MFSSLQPDQQQTESYFYNPEVEGDDLLIQHLQSNEPHQSPSPKQQNSNKNNNFNEQEHFKSQVSKSTTTPILTPHPPSPPTYKSNFERDNNQNTTKDAHFNQIYSSPHQQTNSYEFMDNSLTLSPPNNPYKEINKNLQLEIDNLKAKIENYKHKSKEWKSVEAENQHLRYQIDMLSQENVNLRNGLKETEKQINHNNVNEHRTNELISMLKESHQ